MDDKTRIVRNTEELKGKVQHRALALKDAVADLIPVTKKTEYDLPFTYEICIPENQFIDRNRSVAAGFQLVPASQKVLDQEDVVDVEFEKSIIDADKWDYIVAAASGLLTATMNILWVGELSLENAQAWGRKETDKFVMKVAQTQGYKGDDLSDAIRFLEKAFPLASDKATSDFGGGLQHHLRDFCHHPTIAGLAFSILSQFTGKGYGTKTDGSFQVVDLPEGTALGNNLCEKLFYGTFMWAGHMISDMAGSNQSAGAGTGIPGHILSFLKEVSALPIMKDVTVKYKDDDIGFSVWVSKLFNGTYFTPGENGERIKLDLRTEMGVAFQVGKQAVPVIANECIVRCFYLIRRLYLEIKQKDVDSLADLKALDPKNFLPFNNRTITHMITVSSGVFFAVTTSAAAVKAAVKNKGVKGGFVQDFLLSINYVGVGRFVIALGAETKYVIKDVKKLYHAYRERLDVVGDPVIDFDALDYLALTPEQAKILLSLKRQKVLFDIENTADEAVKTSKREWISEWLGLCGKSLDEEPENCYIDSLKDTFSALRDTANAATNANWLYLITMELATFRPYFPLGDESVKKYKGLKYKADFDKEVFCVEQNLISPDAYKSILKEYKRAISALQNQTQKLAIGASATVAVTVATGGLAWAFAPQIAVMLAGSSFVGLYGAALTNASLALIGGGSLAVGGMGIAGGTAIITGGGALLGIIGSGAATVSSMTLLSSKNYVLNECAKLITFCNVVLVDKNGDKAAVATIKRSLDKGIDEMNHELVLQQEAESEENADKKRRKEQKKCITYLERCSRQLGKLCAHTVSGGSMDNEITTDDSADQELS